MWSATYLWRGAGGLLLVALLAGCGGGGSGSSNYGNQPGWTLESATPTLGTKEWTVLVYMNGANNLDPDSVLNVNQLQKIGSNKDVNVIVQWKRLSSWNGATRRYYITPVTSTTSTPSPTLLSDNANVDMGSPAALQAFVQWGVHAFPAQKYCLVIWDHGAGWRAQQVAAKATGTTSATTTRGVSYDDITGSHIDTTQMGPAIDLGNGFRWDLLAMDASLMQMVEVDYQMRSQVRYIVASEESPSELGYPYDTLLSDLETNPNWDGKTFGIDITQKTLAYYGQNSDSTQSVIDADQLAPLPAAVDALGSALTAASATYPSQIALDCNTAESVDSSDYAGYYRDLGDFVRLLTTSGTSGAIVPDPGVQSAAQGVKTALANAIVYNAHGNYHPNMTGLTIYLPTAREYATIAAEQADSAGPGGGSLAYTSLAFVQAAPNWNSFLVNEPIGVTVGN